MTKTTKLFEMGAEGGSITLYQYENIGEKHEWYFYQVNEMSLDEELSGVDKKSKFSFSFPEALIKMIAEYPNILELYPLYLHENHRAVVMVFLQEYHKKFTYFDTQRWAEIFDITQDEFIKELNKI